MVFVSESLFTELESNAVLWRVQTGDTEPLSELEIKHGLQKVAETLSFVHNSCKRVHCSVSPQSIILAADGTWKLAGLGLSQTASTGT